jgi:hypothetical protein
MRRIIWLPLFLAVVASADEKVGQERWDVKTLTDSRAAGIIDTKQPTTVAKLALLRPPASVADDSPRGLGPEEWNTYRVVGYLRGFNLETDGDYEVMLSDSPKSDKNDPARKTLLCVEIVKPEYVGKKAAASQIAKFRAVRKQFEKIAQVKGGKVAYTWLRRPVKVEVTGVGFWDERHGQRGLWNAFELHPVTGIKLAGAKNS